MKTQFVFAPTLDFVCSKSQSQDHRACVCVCMCVGLQFVAQSMLFFGKNSSKDVIQFAIKIFVCVVLCCRLRFVSSDEREIGIIKGICLIALDFVLFVRVLFWYFFAHDLFVEQFLFRCAYLPSIWYVSIFHHVFFSTTFFLSGSRTPLPVSHAIPSTCHISHTHLVAIYLSRGNKPR